MGILRTNTLSGIGTNGPVFDGVTRLDTQGYFVPPPGTTDQRSAGITTTQGAIRFNTDSQKLEFYAQDQWFEMVIDTPALGTSSDTGAGARGLFGGGYTGTPAFTVFNVIEYITISSTGNVVDFGDLSGVRLHFSPCSSSTRGVFGGGFTPTPVTTYLNTIEYITISSTGNVVDFGDLSAGNWGPTSCSSATRGIFAGGYNTPTVYINTIEYITLSSLGNAINFGDLITTPWLAGACSSSTRAIVGGGFTANPNIRTNVIQYVTIQSQGDAIDFGDLTATKNAPAACSNGHGGL